MANALQNDEGQEFPPALHPRSRPVGHDRDPSQHVASWSRTGNGKGLTAVLLLSVFLGIGVWTYGLYLVLKAGGLVE